MKVAIQGTETSYHALAAQRLFQDGASLELVYCETFKHVFTALNAKQVAYGMVAIENSLYGSINEVYDLLLQHRSWIVGEVYEQIALHLLAPPLATLESLTHIYSQAPALAEAETFLDTQLPQIIREEYYDTGAAAAMVATSDDPTKAAIASIQAMEEYDLVPLAQNIETHHDNYTRFIALSAQPLPISPSANKTSLVFRTVDKAGALYRALGVFADHGISLTKLESRPIVGKAWSYMYYIDFALGGGNGVAQQIIRELSQQGAFEVRLLGSYRSGLAQ